MQTLLFCFWELGENESNAWLPCEYGRDSQNVVWPE